MTLLTDSMMNFLVVLLLTLTSAAEALHIAPLSAASPRVASAPLMSEKKLNMDNAKTVGIGGEMCYRLDQLTAEEASEPFRTIALDKYKSGKWYACTGPADDMELTCFLAPKWMGLPEGQWVCSDIPLDKAPGEKGADDGY